MGNNTNKWTESEDQIIRENYQVLSDEELSTLLPGRSNSAIKNSRRNLE